jgi:glyoxylate/hydroxypyruvate reductase
VAIFVELAGWDEERWKEILQREFIDRDVVSLADDFDPDTVRYTVLWKPRKDVYRPFRNLAAIFSAGAGVDFILEDESLPNVPIFRSIDPSLTERMAGYVIMQVLIHHRKFLGLRSAQANHRWVSVEQPPAGDIRIGVLGLGELGRFAAQMLADLGYDVAGWSRTEKNIAKVACFHASEGLQEILGRSDILISLLPATPHTSQMLDYSLFKKLRKNGPLGGPVLINAGRGELHVEADIHRAVVDGTLAGVSLDVFEKEPLSSDSPLWSHPNVVISPHNAADSDPRAISKYIAGQISKFEAGEPIDNIVDRNHGY